MYNPRKYNIFLAIIYIFLFRKMASKRMTMKRRVIKKGGGKRYKRNKITIKKHYGGITEEKALETIRNIRIMGIQSQINEQNEIIEYVGKTYAIQASPSVQESNALDLERSKAEEKKKMLEKKLIEFNKNNTQ